MTSRTRTLLLTVWLTGCAVRAGDTTEPTEPPREAAADLAPSPVAFATVRIVKSDTELAVGFD